MHRIRRKIVRGTVRKELKRSKICIRCFRKACSGGVESPGKKSVKGKKLHGGERSKKTGGVWGRGEEGDLSAKGYLKLALGTEHKSRDKSRNN